MLQQDPLLLLFLLAASFIMTAQDENIALSDEKNPEKTLALDRPLEREVFQRNSLESADVAISGDVPNTATIVEVRADLPGIGKRGETVPWTEVAKAPFEEGKFNEIGRAHV